MALLLIGLTFIICSSIFKQGNEYWYDVLFSLGSTFLSTGLISIIIYFYNSKKIKEKTKLLRSYFLFDIINNLQNMAILIINNCSTLGIKISKTERHSMKTFFNILEKLNDYTDLISNEINQKEISFLNIIKTNGKHYINNINYILIKIIDNQIYLIKENIFSEADVENIYQAQDCCKNILLQHSVSDFSEFLTYLFNYLMKLKEINTIIQEQYFKK